MNLRLHVTDSNFELGAPAGLSANDVHLWRVDLETIRAEEARWQSVLSEDEGKRAARFHFSADRQRFTAARAWLRMILGAYLQAQPEELRFTYSAKEKPTLAPPFAESALQFNLSHSGGVALYTVTREQEIGVDIEEVRTNSDLEGIAKRFFSAAEQQQLEGFHGEEKVQAFFRCWTRKEAYIKATGDGLSLPLRQFDVSLEAGSSHALLATRPDPSEAAQWRLCEVPAGEGYAAAICRRGGEFRLSAWNENLSC
jgi:4'-phosphopantetheinyl transferase